MRTRLGIEMSGTTFPERWLVVDLKARDGIDAFRHLPYFDFVCEPELPRFIRSVAGRRASRAPGATMSSISKTTPAR